MPWSSAIPARFHQVNLEREYGAAAELEGGAKKNLNFKYVFSDCLITDTFVDDGNTDYQLSSKELHPRLRGLR